MKYRHHLTSDTARAFATEAAPKLFGTHGNTDPFEFAMTALDEVSRAQLVRKIGDELEKILFPMKMLPTEVGREQLLSHMRKAFDSPVMPSTDIECRAFQKFESNYSARKRLLTVNLSYTNGTSTALQTKKVRRQSARTAKRNLRSIVKHAKGKLLVDFTITPIVPVSEIRLNYTVKSETSCTAETPSS